jgi:hypothetical protein
LQQNNSRNAAEVVNKCCILCINRCTSSAKSPETWEIYGFRQVACRAPQEGKSQHEVNARGRKFFSTLDEKMGRDMKWILESEQLAREQGMAAGKIQELQSLHEQVASYYLDMRRAEAADRYKSKGEAKAKENATRTLSVLGQYYNQLNYQQQLLNNLNRPRTCNFFANTMTCQ